MGGRGPPHPGTEIPNMALECARPIQIPTILTCMTQRKLMNCKDFRENVKELEDLKCTTKQVQGYCSKVIP